MITISPELICMISGIFAEAELLLNAPTTDCKNGDGGMGLYSDIGTVAQIAEDYISSCFDFETYADIYCYEVHDSGQAIKNLYAELAKQCHDFYTFDNTEVIAACNAFLSARPDLKIKTR